MRIIKYLFLLLLLSLVALSIFVATQKGEFTVQRSHIINSPKSTVFNFVNDYKNWQDFGAWIVEDPEIIITYPKNTVGKGASFTWEGKEVKGDMQTVFVKENESISQKINYNGGVSSVFLSLKDTVGGTKVTWKTTGKMSFVMKITAALNGGIDTVIGAMQEKSLANLDKTLVYEINTHQIKVKGVVKKLATFYLHQTFTSKISNITKNARIVFPKIILFCEQNNIELNGKPFIIYHTYDPVNGLSRLSFCIPIKNQILTSSGSDILSGKLEPFEALKTTLTGDYSHIKKALDKTTAYSNANKISIDTKFSHLENYTIGKAEIKNPSKWITDIYFPIKPKVIPVKVFAPAAINKPPAVKTPEPAQKKEEEQSEF
ncbi:transcriptional regulator [Flavobacterium sp. ZB4P23]|uniref:SRPBCC family protein n=1 Tax=Flavobacterium sp. ZB4P23 TaxID=2497484 RepID=UPI000F8347B8|nr:SRPBCC family protein [Flavobacterium sp. ZB4P23]RTY82182.1 transcriptional regulator [Flavobacterium sp. ZB4P23]